MHSDLLSDTGAQFCGVSRGDILDAQTAQALLTEIRELRIGLQSSAANIQKVLIVMYRLQSEAWVLDRARQRLESAQEACDQLQAQRKAFTEQVENFEAASEVPKIQMNENGWKIRSSV